MAKSTSTQARPDEPVAIIEGFNVHAARGRACAIIGADDRARNERSGRAAMSTLSFLAHLFGAIAALAALLAPFALLSAIRVKRRSAITTGIVERMERSIANETWIAHIRYEVSGVSYPLRVGSNGGYSIGEPVRVLYSIDEPSRSFLASGGHVWLETTAALLFAVVFGAVAALLAFLDRAL